MDVVTTGDVVNTLNAVPIGSVIAWVMVISGIIAAIIYAIRKTYKGYEVVHDLREQEEEFRDMVKEHDEKIKKIEEKHENEFDAIDKKIDSILDWISEKDDADLRKLRHSLVRAGEEALRSERITVRELKSMSELYDLYHVKMKQNSYVTTLMSRVNKLPVIGKLDEHGNDVEE